MDTIAELVKNYAVPGSLPFLLTGMLIALVVLTLERRSGRLGISILLFFVALYVILSLPLTAIALQNGLSLEREEIPPQRLEKIELIVLLGGGSSSIELNEAELSMVSPSSALRTLRAVELYTQLEQPPILSSGGSPQGQNSDRGDGEAMRLALLELGVPDEKIIVENKSRNTRDQAIIIAQRLSDLGNPEFLLVTSDSHLRRATLAFEQMGLEPVPMSASNSSDTANWQGISWLPNLDALNASNAALREYLALVYYWSQGWIRFPVGNEGGSEL